MQLASNSSFPLITFIQTPDGIQVEIETERLFIRSYQDKDFESSFKLYSDETLTRYFDHGKPKSRLEAKKITEGSGSKYFKQGEPFGLFSIFQKRDGTFVGHIDLIPTGEPGVVEVGYIFDKNYHNQGFCQEGVRALLFGYVNEINNKGFKCGGTPIHKIMATVHPENLPSKKTLEKIGMNLERTGERFDNPRLWYSMPPIPTLKREGNS